MTPNIYSTFKKKADKGYMKMSPQFNPSEVSGHLTLLPPPETSTEYLNSSMYGVDDSFPFEMVI